MGGCFSPPMARVKAVSWLLVGRPFGLDLLGPRHFAVTLGDVVLDTLDRYLAPSAFVPRIGTAHGRQRARQARRVVEDQLGVRAVGTAASDGAFVRVNIPPGF